MPSENTAERADLAAELKRLRERVAAYESSRWWRLHPRLALRRFQRRTNTRTDAPTAVAPEIPSDYDEWDAELCRRVQPYTLTTPGKVLALARAVEYVAKRPIPGGLVECGVWRGGSVMAIALTLLRLGVADRDLYLFDTFAGMTKPGEEDVKRGGRHAADILRRTTRGTGIWAEASVEEVREAVLGVGYPEERIHFVKGPVEDTLPTKAPERIALLRLDTDWYASTKHELTHLYPRLAAGGVLIIDDYEYWLGSRKAVDEYLHDNDLRILLTPIDHGARVAVKV
jgi:O-methyltransferase